MSDRAKINILLVVIGIFIITAGVVLGESYIPVEYKYIFGYTIGYIVARIGSNIK